MTASRAALLAVLADSPAVCQGWAGWLADQLAPVVDGLRAETLNAAADRIVGFRVGSSFAAAAAYGHAAFLARDSADALDPSPTAPKEQQA